MMDESYLDKLFAVNKPKGISSTQYLNKIKKHLRDKFGTKIKIGHGGTLDPNASGVLIVGTGTATKQLTHMICGQKSYIGTVRLGFTSDTYDACGTITETNSGLIPSITQIESNINRFKGIIKQTPPKYSAIHIDGKRAYDLARNNIEFVIDEREVTIYDIKLIDYQYPIIKFNVSCSGGTYIRSIAHDLGILLGCGGYLEDLIRTSVGDIHLVDCVDFS